MVSKKGQDKLKHELKQKVLKEIESMLSDVYSKSIDSVSMRFFSSVQEFFAGYCNLHYKFTYDELLHEIGRKKMFDDFVTEKVNSLLKKLQEKEYSSTDFTRDELNSFLRDFKMIVKVVNTSASVGSFDAYLSFHRILHRLSFSMGNIRSKVLKGEVSRIVDSFPSIEEAAHEGRIEDAQLLYDKMNALYERLSSGEKKAVFPSIHRLYLTIVSAHKDRIFAEMDLIEGKFYHSLEINSIDSAQNYYNEMQSLYESLPKLERPKVYAELKVMFRKLSSQVYINMKTDIERLLTQADLAMKNSELAAARTSYDKALHIYKDLPQSGQKNLFARLNKTSGRINSAAVV